VPLIESLKYRHLIKTLANASKFPPIFNTQFISTSTSPRQLHPNQRLGLVTSTKQLLTVNDVQKTVDELGSSI
jgi:hypothetical protein